MGSVLIVSGASKGSQILAELCCANSCEHVVMAESGAQARRLLIDNSYDLVIINTPLHDEFGQELALNLTTSSTSGIILIVKSELADTVSAKVEDYGVFVVPKPINRQLFYQSFKLVAAARKRLMGLKNENIKLQNKIEEIRLVDRAKYTLIQYLKMTEPQAHRYIEKQAMDMRLTRREIAEEILKTYES